MKVAQDAERVIYIRRLVVWCLAALSLHAKYPYTSFRV